MRTIIGLTGGIGSGKSTIRKIFESFSVPAIDADQIVHDAYQDENSELYKILLTNFGNDCIKIVNGKKEIDRNTLRQILEKTKKHSFALKLATPFVDKKLKEFIDKNKESSIVILEIPLLIEANMVHTVDKVLVVDVSQETQINRVKQRNKLTDEQIQLILNNQLKREQRLSFAHDVIVNEHKSLEQVKAEVEKIIHKYTAKDHLFFAK